MSNVLKMKSAPKLNLKSSDILPDRDAEISSAEFVKQQIEEAYQRGSIEGQQKIKRELEKDYTDKLYKKYEEVYHIIEAYDRKMTDYEVSFEKLIINTASIVAKKIVKREIEVQTAINDNIRLSISKIIGANEVKIKLHPTDINELNDYSKNLINNSSFNKIKFEPDERIEKGGCLIETEIGNVDARISTQLEELRRKLEESISAKES
ncbi:MAG: hypothetical protein HYS25_08660 [Ignavibacteriales bacterium]|nr:hypothetical protein [Ignavibacteriales bacterium]